jgi:L-asparaginase
MMTSDSDLVTSKATIVLIGCGGTISSIGRSALDVMDYPEFGTKLSVQDVLDRFPEAAAFAKLLPRRFSSVGSSAIGPKQWFQLRKLILGLEHEAPAGVVILHGTATLEETAFFLHLTLQVPFPVVLVGAQRPLSAISSDAGMNLISAIRVATATEARNRGVLVVMNDEIFTARDVVKTSNHRLHTFRSFRTGSIGQVDGDGVFFNATALNSATRFAALRDIDNAEDIPRVDIVCSYAGSEGDLIDASVSLGAVGLVSVGFPPGITTPSEKAAIQRAISAGVMVVQCSRAVSGRVVRREYLRAEGIVPGRDLSPQKARILLGLCLLTKCTAEEIDRAFEEI